MAAPGRPAVTAGGARGVSGHPLVLVVTAMVAVQAGAAVATHLIPLVGVTAAAWLRLALATVLIAPVVAGGGLRGVRPPSRAALGWATALGLMLALMNVAFTGAIARLPLGTVVAIELSGPMAVAVLSSRRPRDLAVAGLAAVSVAVLCVPEVSGAGSRTGVALAAVAAAGWGAYILVGRRVARAWPHRGALLPAFAVAAVVMAPFGAPDALRGMDARVAGLAVAVAALGSVLPYSLELVALRRLRPGVFGLLMALEPAIAAAVGLAALGQVPGPLELIGIVGVCVAVALTARATDTGDAAAANG